MQPGVGPKCFTASWVLLKKAEEEFGFDHTGGLTIPCEIKTFKYLFKCMENHTRADDACALEDQSSSNVF
ncbi:hypothetical protein SAY87_022013 [Trapa incisa]|uniref:Uncharacterized protein n=1 Tax=Trapa incisa TaxID=236973 RepID=A0AAN7PX77_9MYRT|nr:hypothetical protein SAY87_022013 [Trapa incisa]